MNELKIFLGSSFRLSKFRNRIGAYVHQASTAWLNQGIWLKLLIWEDYPSYYAGTSKQHEYTRELTLRSDLAVFLFSDRVGMYTQQELEAKQKQNPNAIICYLLPAKNGKYSADVETQLNNLKVPFKKVTSAEDILADLDGKINNFASSHNLATVRQTGMKDLWFYTTIPDDLGQYQQRIGTTMRHVDDLSISLFNIHCALHERCHPELLDTTDHYIPIFGPQASDADAAEFSKALGLTPKLDITLFKAKDYNKNTKIKSLYKGKDLFERRCEGIDSIAFEMMTLLAEKRKALFSNADVTVSSSAVSISGKEVATTESLDKADTLSLVVQQVSQKASQVDNLIATGVRDASLANAVSDYNNSQQRASYLFLSRINGWTDQLLAEDDAAAVGKISDLDATVAHLMEDAMTPQKVARVKILLLEKESIVRSLAEENPPMAYLLLATQMKLVAVYDTFLQGVRQNDEEDALYARIVSNADQYGVKSPFVESCRMNLGNSYARKEQVEEANRLYEASVANLETMNDGTLQFSRTLSIHYVHLIHSYAGHRDFERGNKSLEQFRQHIERLGADDDYLVDRCLYETCFLHLINKNDKSRTADIIRAYNTFQDALLKLTIPTDDHVYSDIFIYLPNLISACIIDHFDEFVDKKEAYSRAERLIHSALERANMLLRSDYSEALHWLGELYHQLGFLHSMVPPYWISATHEYDEALKYRRLLFEQTRYSEYEVQIAQTLVNRGAMLLLCIENPDIHVSDEMQVLKDAISGAEEAMEIYKRHVNPEYENTECHIYEALQLRGTILYQMYKMTDAPVVYNQAMEDLFTCWRWNLQHPDNEYKKEFNDHAGRILREHKLI